MASPSEKLAQSLEVLQQLQDTGKTAIYTRNISRVHRERLLKNGFLQEVMKGWYIPSRPDQADGESTTWFASFWLFCSDYLKERFGDDWCLSPEQSILIHVGNRTVPRQCVIRATKGTNNVTVLPYQTSILDARQSIPEAADIEQKNGVNVYRLPTALIACSPSFFRQYPNDARAALASVPDASDLLRGLLKQGHSVIAGRLAGAFRNIGNDRIADDILSTMKAAGYTSREEDPFKFATPIIFRSIERSPYVNRMRMMWQSMSKTVLTHFPVPPGAPADINTYLERVKELYVTDAYHSLSIEGYRVSPDLIDRVRGGKWNPDFNKQDREQLNALAARGYWLASETVCNSLARILCGENPGQVVNKDHGSWYRDLFTPFVLANLLNPSDLAGYRNNQVFIRYSKHVPPNYEAVRDLMPAFFDLLQNEKEPAIRVVLGHFVFVYIHPYMDGNGRIGRFVMNAMLASGGYPWTVIPVSRKTDYLNALEQASVDQNIQPFAKLLALLVNQTIAGNPEAI